MTEIRLKTPMGDVVGKVFPFDDGWGWSVFIQLNNGAVLTNYDDTESYVDEKTALDRLNDTLKQINKNYEIDNNHDTNTDHLLTIFDVPDGILIQVKFFGSSDIDIFDVVKRGDIIHEINDIEMKPIDVNRIKAWWVPPPT
ncbi:MAG: hypothetical protein WC284_12395 [Candidimonas sp.]